MNVAIVVGVLTFSILASLFAAASASETTSQELIKSGSACFDNKNFSEAATLWKRALAVSEKNKNNNQICSSLYNLVLADLASGNYSEAETYALRLKNNPDKPKGMNYDFVQGMLADTYFHEYKYAKAEVVDKEILAVSVVETTRVGTQLHLGVMQIKQGKFKQALQTLLDTAERCRKMPENPGLQILSEVLERLEAVNLDLNNLKDAESYGRQSVELTRKIYGSQNTRTANVLSDLGEVLKREGKFSEAQNVFKSSFDCSSSTDPVARINYLNNSGCVYLDEGKIPESQRNFAEAENLARKISAKSLLVQSLGNLASAYGKSGQKALAIKTFNQAIEMARDPKLDTAIINSIKMSQSKFSPK